VPELHQQFREAALAVRALLDSDSSPQTHPGFSDAAVQDLAYAALRSWGLAQARLARLAPKAPDPLLMSLLSVAFSCLSRAYRADAVVVDQAVHCARGLGGEPAARFVNAVLRKTLLHPTDAQADEQTPLALWNAPRWWQEKILSQLGHDRAEQVRKAQRAHPPFTLRLLGTELEQREIAHRLGKGAQDLRWLGPQTVIREPACDMSELPGFPEGLVRAQDDSAQRLFGLLGLKAGDQVLDACAAPGGKSFLLAEQAAVDVWALDASKTRLARLSREMQRLSARLAGEVHPAQADLLLDDWPDLVPKEFDHIVLDAPCSGSGVVCRHPEIPWRRSEAQLAGLVRVQAELLQRLWKRLKPGGEFVYIVCSIFEEEAQAQVNHWMDQQPDATPLSSPGLILPALGERDGFFYARFQKAR